MLCLIAVWPARGVKGNIKEELFVGFYKMYNTYFILFLLLSICCCLVNHVIQDGRFRPVLCRAPRISLLAATGKVIRILMKLKLISNPFYPNEYGLLL